MLREEDKPKVVFNEFESIMEEMMFDELVESYMGFNEDSMEFRDESDGPSVDELIEDETDDHNIEEEFDELAESFNAMAMFN